MTDDSHTALFIALRSRLHAAAQRILISNDDADDALQELFIRTWRNGHPESSSEQQRAFLYRSLRNVCIDFLRQRTRIERHEKEAVTDRYTDPVERIDNTDTLEAIRREARRRLTGMPLKVFELYAFQELEYYEIAQILDIKPEVARSYMCRARKIMKEQCHRILNGQ